MVVGLGIPVSYTRSASSGRVCFPRRQIFTVFSSMPFNGVRQPIHKITFGLSREMACASSDIVPESKE